MNFQSAIFLFFAGALGGGINAVAGGGSFVAFPALLFTGAPAIPANATNTLALWVGTTASGNAYQQKLNIPLRILIPLVITSLVGGGLAGAILLIHTPAKTFLRVIPWLLLGATLLFAFGKHLTGRISAGISHDTTNAAVTGTSIFELLVAVYGGYFGGGIGIMNLAMLSALGMTDIHAMNKLKVRLGGVQRRCHRDICGVKGNFLAASDRHDGRLGSRRLFHRALCTKAAAILGESFRHPCGYGHDDLFFLDRLSLAVQESESRVTSRVKVVGQFEF